MESFCALQRELLQLEHAAEMAEAIECLESAQMAAIRGRALLNVQLQDVSTALFGKTIAGFGKPLANGPCDISSGDVVGVFNRTFGKTDAPIVSGVVWSVDAGKQIRIVLDDPDGYSKIPTGNLNIVKLGNVVTHRRLMHTVNDLQKSQHALVKELFAVSPIDVPCIDTISMDRVNSPELNASQNEAVSRCLASPLLNVIHGPPGTGKTTTLAAVIAALVARDPNIRILACAPSNVATDNLAIKTLQKVKKIMRLGHPTRVHADLLKHTLDAQVRNSDFYGSCREIEAEVRKLLATRGSYAEIKLLRKELKERELKSVQQATRGANVVFATCNGAFNLVGKLFPNLFDVCVIDECAQGLEMSSWIPILQAKRTILGGDHLQLSATVKSSVASARGLGISLFEKCLPLGRTHALSVQYRMHADIMGWSNAQFYSGKLVAHESVRARSLTIPDDRVIMHNDIDVKTIVQSPFVFCDTCGVDGMAESTSEEFSSSKSNLGEIGVVKTYVNLLTSAGFPVTVISPYLKQTELLREALGSEPLSTVSTIDSFQGREASVIVISLVRSNSTKFVGFLADYRRLNVAVTRAQQQVFIVGDSETISSDLVLKSVFEYACGHGTIISAEMFANPNYVGLSKTDSLLTVKTNARQQPPKKQQLFIKQDEVPICNDASFLDILSNLTGRHDFPVSLTAPQRREVHAAAERLGLKHGSSGTEPNRLVWVANVSTQRSKDTIGSNDTAKQAIRISECANKVREEPSKFPPATKKKSQQLSSVAGVCPFNACTTRVTLIAIHCEYCGKDFCVPHALPEVHGCDALVSLGAKKDIKNALKKLKAPQPIIPKKLTAVAPETLRKKLNQKLDKMEQSRS